MESTIGPHYSAYKWFEFAATLGTPWVGHTEDDVFLHQPTIEAVLLGAALLAQNDTYAAIGTANIFHWCTCNDVHLETHEEECHAG